MENEIWRKLEEMMKVKKKEESEEQKMIYF
jgi:hypothetical protein